jgi:uncharacterized membrane protein
VKKWIPFILIAGTVAFTLSVYDQLPARVVTHWGTNGPNGWSSREFAAWFGPALAVVLWGVMSIVPRIDPRRANYDKFQGSYDSLVILSVALACVVHFAVLGYALGWPIDINRFVPVLVGGLFLYFGWMLPRARSNFFVGIRTPWTLSSDEVWQRTHRLAGWLFAVAGLLVMSLAVVRESSAVLKVIVAAGIIALIPVPYSYFIWRGRKS